LEDTITTIYCLCEEFLKATAHHDDPQVRLSTAEVMTVALTASAFFGSNMDRSRLFLHQHGYMPNMISKSRLNRRLHAIPLSRWDALFGILAAVFKESNDSGEYIVDSFPIPVCDNIRIRRCRLYRGEQFRGYIASKKRYFYGLRVHMIVTAEGGKPVEFFLKAGATNDNLAFKGFELDLPEDSTIYADKQYNDYHYEDLLQETASIRMRPLRKRNSKRPFAPFVEYIQQRMRKRIETSFSQIGALLPKKIHAVTAEGFELKVVCFVLAFAIQVL
jgi:Transposase DDE domain